MTSIFGNVMSCCLKRFYLPCVYSRGNEILRKSYCSSLMNSKDAVTSAISTNQEWKKDFDELEEFETKSVLAPSNENLSDYVKNVSRTFNFAPYVNKSPLLQDMVKLGVDLFKIERKFGGFQAFIDLDYENEFKKRITFLSDYVEPSTLGWYITKNPFIFKEDLDDMQTRINYLLSKSFTKTMIKSVVSRNPYWLNFSTTRIDNRLGWFQSQFQLSGNEVRKIAVAEPRLITYNLHHVETNKFSVLEEMGFELDECKQLLISHPRIWMLNNKSLMDRFIYIHNTMNIPHAVILKMPTALYCRTSRLRQRHTFLQKIGRAQYDYSKPNYISLLDIVTGTDAKFCLDVAKTSLEEYNAYLKSI